MNEKTEIKQISEPIPEDTPQIKSKLDKLGRAYATGRRKTSVSRVWVKYGASKILVKNPKYDLAFYFKCNLKEASKRRWHDLKKSIPLKEIKKSLRTRTMMDKKRKNSPLIKVKDAILIRTDKLNKKQVLTKMSEHIEKLN